MGNEKWIANIIELEQVSKKYQMGEVCVAALDNISLHVTPGEFLVVLGPSGSGKTTLLNLIGALDTATSGYICIGGQNITQMSRAERFRYRREMVSFIFQSFNLFPGLTALENVQFGMESAERKTNGTTAKGVLRSVGLESRLHHFPHQLSGGEQQRVAIARALATGNPILLADEPTGELDFKTGIQILELLHEQSHNGKTVLIVTHNREIARVADRVIELSSGHIVSDGVPENHRAAIADLSW
ncbi:MAG: ABC transporter ATP-binding protein [Anaerolineae bacterium]|nr:ABC transporter ATP-binding protein [Anaerolineae bacterium]